MYLHLYLNIFIEKYIIAIANKILILNRVDFYITTLVSNKKLLKFTMSMDVVQCSKTITSCYFWGSHFTKAANGGVLYIPRKKAVLESLFDKVAKKRLQHRYFPVNITKFLRTSALKYIWEWLLLTTGISQKTHRTDSHTGYFSLKMHTVGLQLHINKPPTATAAVAAAAEICEIFKKG